MADRELTNKQKVFVAEYMKDKNATRAAIRAGYSERSAQEQSSRLLSNDMVKAEINKNINKIKEEALVDAEYVVKNLREVVERSLQKKAVMKFDYEDKQLKQETVRTEKDGEIKEEGVWEYDSHGVNKALELLGRYLKLFDKDGDKPATINIVVRDYAKNEEDC